MRVRRPVATPITRDELESLVAASSDLRLNEGPADDGDLLFHWATSEPGDAVEFVLVNGEISTLTTPSNAALRRIQMLATELEARVYGEEGDDLTDVPVPEWEQSSSGTWGCVALLAVFVTIVVWWLL